MTQAQPLGARDIPDHQYGKALAAKWMKGMGYLGRSQSLAGLECSSEQPCRHAELFAVISEAVGEKKFTRCELQRLADANDGDLSKVLEIMNPQKLGRRLESMEGQAFDGLTIKRVGRVGRANKIYK